MEIAKLNQSKKIKISTYIGVVLIVIFSMANFGQYYFMKQNFKNPLIPEYLIEIATWPYLKKGLILLAGLIVIIVLKYLKRNLFAFCIVILLIAYYIFSDHYIGGWHSKINL